jgi:hypothetical protein
VSLWSGRQLQDGERRRNLHDITLRCGESVTTAGASLTGKYLLGTYLLKRLQSVQIHPSMCPDLAIRALQRLGSLAYLTSFPIPHAAREWMRRGDADSRSESGDVHLRSFGRS